MPEARMTAEYIHRSTGLIVQIEPDAGGGYFALCPALPGCGSQGESISECLRNVADAIDLVLDVLREDQPERWASIIGCISVQSELAPVFHSTSSSNIEIRAVA